MDLKKIEEQLGVIVEGINCAAYQLSALKTNFTAICAQLKKGGGEGRSEFTKNDVKEDIAKTCADCHYFYKLDHCRRSKTWRVSKDRLICANFREKNGSICEKCRYFEDEFCGYHAKTVSETLDACDNFAE